MPLRSFRALALLILPLLALGAGPVGAAEDDYISFRPLANQVAPQVVSVQARWTHIQHTTNGTPFETYLLGNTGSGFIYNTEGHIVTAYSNISRSPSGFLSPRDKRASRPDHLAEYIKIVFSDRATYRAFVVGYDKDLDIAVLKLEGARDRVLEPLNLVTSDDFRLGQPVLTLAYNFLTRDRINVSFGVVSALRSQFPSLEESVNDFIQIAFPKNAGYDGGAIVDMDGNAVAMMTSAQPYDTSVEVHFGIPAGLLKDRVEKILERGYVPKPWFGFNLIAIQESIQRSYQIPEDIEGMFIVYVEPGSPAATAGLRNEDILAEFNGVPIDSLDALNDQLEVLKVGDTANLVYLRRDFNVYDRFSTTFTLLEKPRPAVVQTETTTETRIGYQQKPRY